MTLLAFAAIYLIWGSTFLAIRIAIGTIPPLLMMGVRCVSAGLVLLAAGRLRGERPPAGAWKDAVVAGALMFACAYGALAWAELRLASGVTALLVGSVPFWLVLIEWRQRGLRPSPRVLTGLVVGLGGLTLLVARGLGGPLPLVPAAIVLGGEAAWAAGSLYAQVRLPAPTTLGAGMPLVAGGLLLAVLSFAVGEWRHFDARAVSGASLMALAYLVLFGSIVAFSAYSWLLRVAPASLVGTHAYVNPVVALALGAVAAGEPLTPAIIVAAGVITVGVAVVLADDSARGPDVWRPLHEAALAPAVARVQPVQRPVIEGEQRNR